MTSTCSSRITFSRFSLMVPDLVGEGETTICELAEVAEGLRDPHSVKGLVFRENGAWVVTEPRPELMDLAGKLHSQCPAG